MKFKWNGWKKSIWIGRLLIKISIAKSGSWSTKEDGGKYERVYIFHIGLLKKEESELNAFNFIFGPLALMAAFAKKGE